MFARRASCKTDFLCTLVRRCMCTFIFQICSTFKIYFVLISGLFQSTGWPCVVSVMGNWFGKSRYSTTSQRFNNMKNWYYKFYTQLLVTKSLTSITVAPVNRASRNTITRSKNKNKQTRTTSRSKGVWVKTEPACLQFWQQNCWDIVLK